jgi:endonuclease/exonuclease/phosphatase (EEP) superfamily protein YafD
VRAFAVALASLALAGCVTLTSEPRAVVLRAGKLDVQSLRCDVASIDRSVAAASEALDGRAIRVVNWNIHKQDDPGWQDDLARFVAAADVVLLQEAVVDADLRRIVEDTGFGWVMASSFLYGGHDIGVLTASRVPPLASCTQRVGEPLIVVPKSAVVSWFRIDGVAEPLAVVNVHAINFSLTLGAYEAQLAALADALARHRGPIVFAGDLNTWTDERREALAATAKKLGLVEAAPAEDRRSLFMGRQLDHMLVRGLDVVELLAIPVKSSDHNPLVATLRAK